jgi:hypothetical protein
LNQARIENDLVRFPITGLDSRILTIKIPDWERIKLLSDPLLDGKRESKNKSKDFKRIIIKNQERIMTINPHKFDFF